MSQQQTIAVLGLGTIGSAIARNFLKAGFDVRVYNRDFSKAQALAGAYAARTPREAAAGATYVLSVVADDVASRAVWTGENGALQGLASDAIAVECTTASPAWVAELRRLATEQGVEMLDAPFTGSKPQADAGQLVFLVGGDAATLDRCRPVLAATSREIIHMGPSGSGCIMKLINNFVCGTQAAAIAEALAMIERTDLDPARALKVLNDGAPGSPMTRTVSDRMVRRDYDPKFSLKLMAKDMAYAIDEAKKLSLDLQTAGTALAMMKSAIAAGFGDQDFSTVIEPRRKRS